MRGHTGACKPFSPSPLLPFSQITTLSAFLRRYFEFCCIDLLSQLIHLGLRLSFSNYYSSCTSVCQWDTYRQLQDPGHIVSGFEVGGKLIVVDSCMITCVLLCIIDFQTTRNSTFDCSFGQAIHFVVRKDLGFAACNNLTSSTGLHD